MWHLRSQQNVMLALGHPKLTACQIQPTHFDNRIIPELMIWNTDISQHHLNNMIASGRLEITAIKLCKKKPLYHIVLKTALQSSIW